MAGMLVKVTPEQRDVSVIYVASPNVACDGGGGPLGHPLTYYDLGRSGRAACGYCDKSFILAGGPADDRSA